MNNKEWRTYQQWKDDGYYVMEGERSSKRTKTGVPLFSEDQVVEVEWEYDDGDDFFYEYD